MGFLWGLYFDLAFFGFSTCWVSSWVFGRCLSFGSEFLVYFVVVFSARVLGAGFRPGVFAYGFHRRDDGLDWVEVSCRHLHCGCVLFLSLLLWPSASAGNKI